jgi:hypothetical protein
MKSPNTEIKWKYIFLTVLVLAFIPFPTELVPELSFAVVDEKNQPLPDINTEQSWRNYTFFGVGGDDEKCTGANGIVTFPRRFLWASAVSRVVFPVLAQIGTLVHGSTGTSSHVRVFDRNYISDFYYWEEELFSFADQRKEFPTVAVAKYEFIENAKSCK